MFSSFKFGALAVACASTALASYVLEDDYSGASFFDGFEFITTDPTLGYVNYLTHDLAKGTNNNDHLINYNSSTGSTYIGVDHWSTLDPAGTGRASVRIESTKKYQYGLIILDLAHMPSNQDGLWPAFWTASHIDYPGQGEIDILENIHSATISRQALHTNPGCSVTANKVVKQQTGNQISYDCDDNSLLSKYGKQYFNEGCVAEGADDKMYGDAFNKAGGGVYATEWTSDAISIWFFGAGKVPLDIINGTPIPSSKWGKPAFTTAHSTCVIDNYFKDHQIILNTDFCGTWAGKADVWQSTSSYSSKYPTCESYVAANPQIYKSSYWEINSIKVYKNSTSVSSSSSSSIPSSSTATHMSSSSTARISSTESSVLTLASTSTIAKFTPSSSPLAESPARSSESPRAGVTNITSSARTTSSSHASYTSASVSPTNIITSSLLSSGNLPPTPTSGFVGSSEPPLKEPHSSSALANAGSFLSNSSSLIVLPEFTPVTAHPSLASATTTSSVLYRNSTETSVQENTLSTTSTVYATSIYTVTSCAPTVTNCPAKLGQITTEIIELYTTVCPITKTQTEKGSASPTPMLAQPSSTEYSISTVYTTVVYPVTTCTSGATDCATEPGSVATKTIALYTTLCPISASHRPTTSVPASSYPATTSPEPAGTGIGSVASISSSTTTQLSTINRAETSTYTTIRTIKAPHSTESTGSLATTIASLGPSSSVTPTGAESSSAADSAQTSAIITLAPSITVVGTAGFKTTSISAAGSATARPIFEGAASVLRVNFLMAIGFVTVLAILL